MPNRLPSSQRPWRAVLRAMTDGSVLVGVLGEDPARLNHRVFRLSSGQTVHQYVAVSLLKRGMLKVVSEDGVRREFEITQAGMDAVTARRAVGVE